MLTAIGSGPAARAQLLERVTAARVLSDLPVGPAALVVAPPDQAVAPTDVEGVLVTERDVGQDDGDRVRRLARVDAPSERPTRWFGRLRRVSSADDAGPRCLGG